MRRIDTPEALDAHRTQLAVAGVAVLGLLARLWALGYRMAHWDEGRVGVRILEYLHTGQYVYDPIVHGPFLFQVNRRVFALLGADDFTMRLVVAVVGAGLPLVALLFRTRLRDAEVVGLAALLAANPLLLYYSRFMRNDVLVAAFGLAAVGFGVRAMDRGSRRSLYAASASLALAFTAKENALMYVGTWVGAAALVVDHRLMLARARERGTAEVARESLRTAGTALRAWWPALALAAVEFLAVVAVFYAPRPDLYAALANPLRLPGVLDRALLDAADAFYRLWVGGGHQNHAYIPFFESFVATLEAGALAVVVLAVGGFVVDRYRTPGGRPLVAFAGYWGFVSVLLYPLANDIPAPWSTVHAVAPLAIPAAVALALVYERGRVALAGGDRVGVALASVLLVLVAAQVGVTAVDTSFRHPQDPNPMVQYGQPDDDLKPVLAAVQTAVTPNDGAVDVGFYGSHFASWTNRLPLPWYLDRYGATVEQYGDPTALPEDPPPVVIAPSPESANIDETAADIDARMRSKGYVARGPYAITQEIPNNEVYVTVYLEESALEDAKPQS